MTNPNPPRDPNAPRPIDEAREQRDANARAQRTQDIRAQALGLALTAATMSGVVQSGQIWPFADAFTAYISDGTKPGDPPPPAPPAR